MLRRGSSDLLHLFNGSEVKLLELGGFEEVAKHIPRPTLQVPRVLHFIGRKRKSAALKYIFSQNHIIQARGNSLVVASIRADTSSLNHENPILFVESDPFCPPTTTTFDQSYGHVITHPLFWHEDEPHTHVNAILHTQILFNFADVVCIFVEDYDTHDLTGVVSQWLVANVAQARASTLKPVLLLVSSGPLPHELCQVISTKSGNLGAFLEVHHYALGSESVSSLTRFLALKDVLMHHLRSTFDLRQKSYAALSFRHLQSLFQSAILHCSRSSTVPFDFCAASQTTNAGTYMTGHICHFMQLAQRQGICTEDTVSLVSTALALDAYPPKMHVFDPLKVFHLRYLIPCANASKHLDSDSQRLYLNQLQNTFQDCGKAVEAGQTSASLRLKSFEVFSQLTPLYSNVTCLCCLANSPEHILSCGHSICDQCLLIFGFETPELDHQFLLNACVYCRQSLEFKARIRPPTAGIRVLSIDGGGTRGVIPLEFLCLIQILLKDIPIRDCFDLSMGTSSGGIIVLALFKLLWDPMKCRDVFEKLATKMFSKEEPKSSLWAWMKHAVRCWVADEVRSARDLEEELQEIFEVDARLFGAPKAAVSGPKYGAVAASIADASACIFANYNGPGLDQQLNGYRLMRPQIIEEEPQTWKAARATSAAPLLYKTIRIGDLGDFQDGGLKHNNPSRLVYWESRRLWPAIRSPGVFLSLGTGREISSTVPHSSRFRHILVDGFVPRLFRSCLSKSDGELMWTEFINSVGEEKQDYFRMNVNLEGPLALDCITQMPWMRNSVNSSVDGTAVCLDVAQALVVSMFYFQLDLKPPPTREGYFVQGSIRCRFDANLVVNTMMHLNMDLIELCTDSDSLSKRFHPKDDICYLCGRFKRTVQFYVRHPSEIVNIYIKNGTNLRRISGFPQSIEWFVRQQGLEDHFGSKDHSVPGRSACSVCTRNAKGYSTGRRKVSYVATGRKRRRLSSRRGRSLKGLEGIFEDRASII